MRWFTSDRVDGDLGLRRVHMRSSLELFLSVVSLVSGLFFGYISFFFLEFQKKINFL